ncbi:C40 family peptidase [Streptosporangium sandarakinum]|uniref:Cell wall-associated NlpC family hydrolase n=1 Tax=Streptosporangium sandarakinum TaxID=1260955 RepID=A0A852V7K9_9ACTN|nr:C40 family peptidase [Streptosporangium sandarakinum]NYF42351.1 cell wall-associated NlpC family hydrolase [Streptosporangium sandarakinum]
MEGIALSGKLFPRALSIVAVGTAALAAPAAAMAATPTPSPVVVPSSTLATALPAAIPTPAPAPSATAEPESTAKPGSTSKPAQATPAKAPEPAWKKAVEWAMSKRGTPYVWGGTGHGGFDCSGLMQRAYGAAGIKLPRVTYDQYAAFDKKISWNNLKPGDLVFFSGLGHVGMISRPGYMVHAPRTGDVVREEKLSSWRRSVFAGAVRPDREGVKLAIENGTMSTGKDAAKDTKKDGANSA